MVASILCLRFVVDSLGNGQCDISKVRKQISGNGVPINCLPRVEFTQKGHKTIGVGCSTRRKIDVRLLPQLRITQVKPQGVERWPQRLWRGVSLIRRSLRISLNAKTKLLSTILQAKKKSLDISRSSVPRYTRRYSVGKRETLASTQTLS